MRETKQVSRFETFPRVSRSSCFAHTLLFLLYHLLVFSMPGALSSPTTQSGQNPAAHFSGNGFTLGSDEDAADQGQGHSTTKTGMPGRGGYQALP
jgi:hypothetical protein